MALLDKKPKNKCPAREVFIRAFLDDASLEEKEKLVDHVLSCQKCKLIFNVMKQLSIELAVVNKDIEEIKLSPSEVKQFRAIAKQKIRELKKGEKRKIFGLVPVEYIAPIIGLLIIFGGYLYFSNFRHKEIYRNAGREELILLEPSKKISAPPTVLIWTPLRNNERIYYKIELIDDELNTLLSRTVYNTYLTIPESTRQKLRKGRVYVWKVEALIAEDKILASAMKHFEIE